MSEPFLGEIRPFAFGYAPRGWAQCAGQLLPIAQNTALFSILGASYGGDGRTTFALPDLRDRVPIHAGTGTGLTTRVPGETGGSASVTLTANELPAHTHGTLAQGGAGDSAEAPGHYWAGDAGGDSIYAPRADAPLAADALAPVGAGQPHDNLQPSLAVNFCIAMQGIYPPRG